MLSKSVQVFTVLSVLLSGLTEAQAQKTGLRTKRKLLDTFSCILYEVATDFDDHKSIFEHVCENDSDNDQMYSIDDNNDVISLKLGEGGLDVGANSGRYKITMTNVIVDLEPVVTTTPSTVVSIQDLGVQTSRRRLDIKQGERSMVIIRVNGDDKDNDYSKEKIADSFFGVNGDVNNLASRYKACSMDKLLFVPGQGAQFTDGVAEININVQIEGAVIADVVKIITNKLVEQFGSNLKSTYTHVVYAVPRGTTFGAGGSNSWLAFAYMNHYLSVYNDNNIIYISNQVHETGHNLGLTHSSHGGVTYGDQSGTMGYGYGQEDTPEMCFNAAKSWQLGWYQDKSAEYNPAEKGTFTGYLTAFVDYKSVTVGEEFVQFKILDYFLIYNKAKGINHETKEFANMVTITEMVAENKYSESVAALGAGNTFTGKGIAVKVCTMETIGGVDKAKISIFVDGQPDGCSSAPTSASGVEPVATPSPTPVPLATPSPVPDRTNRPTYRPTPRPTSAPVAPLTPVPTHAPSPGPTSAPVTPGPTQAPSPGPTAPPTASPTPQPTPRPTDAPVTPQPTHADCPDGTMDVRITIMTDIRPQETSWYFKMRGGAPVDSATNLNMAKHEYSHRYCVPDDKVYEFRLSDSGGDGIKSTMDSIEDQGFYEISVNGEIYSSGGQFEYDEVDYIQGPCEDNKELLQFVLTTGTAPGTVTWKLQEDGSAVDIAEGGPWPSHNGRSISYVAHECLDPSKCYTYSIFSANGDGLHNGHLEVNWNSNNVAMTPFESGPSLFFPFGNC
eukprot:CAMPEP_0119002810 /NCGR_PEP_ID=MMETSP1176-20130426/143_1 /TAXON_ID=265551 /ORGANISM="Synedropsis recta cf, Strain CCMP1620" /LENGTH=783 /DNA_ID=CAMNT_0006954337 /DNA_START=114 /DNA_END=2465 /DNA_ORIENTATION=+